jgi:argininosuccinate lyase
MTDLVSPPSYVRTPAARFLSSLAVDRALAPFDLAGSIAHVEMLVHTGIQSQEAGRTLVGGLRAMAREVSEGTFPWRDDLEDVHTNLEVRLTALVGPVGASLHTARSRNDQVALDERLYLRAAGHDVAQRLLEVSRALVNLARSESATPMPGYTHLQRAQVVTVGHWLLAHFWRFDRDLDRLGATMARSDVSPLGAGALAGSTLPIDPAFVAHRLGFDHPFENSIDAVSDRDYFAEFLFDLSLLAVHASALAEEVVLFASKEFHFLERTAALGSGSSLMPQKRNPDVAELVRGKAGRAVGDLVALLTVLKALPLAYDRDLQEDKGLVFDAVSTVTEVLEALTSALHGLSFDQVRLHAAAEDPELYATDLAEWLVSRGVPFRTAYESVAALYATPGRLDSQALPPSVGLNPAEAEQWFDPSHAVERRSSPGGPGSASLQRQLSAADARLSARAASLSSLERKVELIEDLLKEDAK